MVLDLVWFDADKGPVARRVSIVDIAPLDFVRAEQRPPNALCGAGERERDAFGDYRCARRGVVSERRDKFEEVLVCER